MKINNSTKKTMEVSYLIFSLRTKTKFWMSGIFQSFMQKLSFTTLWGADFRVFLIMRSSYSILPICNLFFFFYSLPDALNSLDSHNCNFNCLHLDFYNINQSLNQAQISEKMLDFIEQSLG